ncbi:YhdP family protein [Lichenifustis flavocetrariae]|uniref:DUF3971 domain-containing protein n=1 Tax=Lichenifustis flavocetrariae TaxID=2949735 RepID=A0AA41YX49_9HYPH|nr:DUF3971 domain-containing protein [Lichenifustis flavocetrariae]MCW6509744.1 DUF3971 domain-containing protein [Lichenifustis flavocetrariae]
MTFAITVLLFVAAAFGLLSLRLAHGPITVAALDAPVLDALSAHLRPGFHVGIEGVDVEAVDGRPAIALKQMLVRDEAGRPIFRAPRAVISVDPVSLLTGSIVPTRLDVQNVVLKLSILPDGSTALSAGSEDTAPLRVSEAIAMTTAAPSAATPPRTNGSGAETPPPEATPATRFASALAGVIDQFSDAVHGTGGLDRFGVGQGTLILDDRTHDTITSFRNLDLDYQKLSDRASRMSLAADGDAGRWSVQAWGSHQEDGRRTLSADANGITLDDLRAIPAFRDIGVDTDLPFSANVTLGLDPSGALVVARGHVGAGSGFVRIHDPDHEPYLVNSLEGSFHFDPGAQAILVDAVTLKADTSNYQVSGRVTPPSGERQPWALSLSGKGVFGQERPGEKPIALENIVFSAHVAPTDGSVTVDAFHITGPQVDLSLQVALRSSASGLSIKGSANAGRMPAPALLRIWPTPLAAEVRAWLLVNLQGGMVERGSVSFALDDADLAKMRLQRSIADSHLRLDYAVSDVSLAFMDGVPPLRKVIGHGVVTGDTSSFAVDTATIEVTPGHQLAVASGGLVVPSTDPKPAAATITAHVAGAIDTLTDLLSRDALKPYANLPSDIGNARGQIEGDLSVDLKIGRGATSKDVKIGANAQISALAIDKLVGKQGLTDGQIGLALDKTGLRLKGDARLFGAPTTLDVKKPAGAGPGEANAVLVMDDAARVKAGLNFGKQLTGSITAKVSVGLGDGDHKPATVDVDLSRAAVNNLIPGLLKPAGKPGRLTLTITQTANGVALDNVTCDMGTFTLRGAAVLDSDGGFQSARLSQIKLSPSDDMKADVTQGPDGLKLVIRGTNIDARPFLKNLTGSDSSPSESGSKNIEVEMHSSVLTGQNSQVLTAVDLRMVKRDAQIRKVQLTGKFGRSSFEVKSSQQGRDLVLDASSADAGATLAFLDLYKKVSGGQLDATIHMSETKFDGYATIHNFALREDPAMKRLTEEGISQEKSGSVQIDTSNLGFTKLYVIFNKAGSRMNIRDGGMFGPQMGATVRGWIDLGGDRIQLNGTYVPAYGVNNLFSQIPVLGPILGGGSHEGLFGINYRLTGSIASPNLTVDPLSALAPGFLREIFGAISEATQEGSAPTPGRKDLLPDNAAR